MDPWTELYCYNLFETVLQPYIPAVTSSSIHAVRHVKQQSRIFWPEFVRRYCCCVKYHVQSLKKDNPATPRQSCVLKSRIRSPNVLMQSLRACSSTGNTPKRLQLISLDKYHSDVQIFLKHGRTLIFDNAVYLCEYDVTI